MSPIFVGILLNSALYLSGCFIAGLVTGNPVAWRLALAAMGIVYICYCLQGIGHRLSGAVTWLSVALGAAAGLSLLWIA